MNLWCPSTNDPPTVGSLDVASSDYGLWGLGLAFMEFAFRPQCDPKYGFVILFMIFCKFVAETRGFVDEELRRKWRLTNSTATDLCTGFWMFSILRYEGVMNDEIELQNFLSRSYALVYQRFESERRNFKSWDSALVQWRLQIGHDFCENRTNQMSFT